MEQRPQSSLKGSAMRDALLLGARVVIGGYLVVHGAQKLFGAFDGPGLDQTGAYFETIGLSPGKEMATLAGATEVGGGLLTMTGTADPAGPLAIIGAMSIASFTQRANGPLAAKGGFELPLSYLAAATAFVASGPGRFRLSPPLPGKLAAVTAGLGLGLALGTLAKMARSAVAAEQTEQATTREAQPQPA
jgi:putative oxidoreductase